MFEHVRYEPKARATDVHSLSDPRAGERVSLQQVPDETEAHRDITSALSDRETGENLVPESTHEMEEGNEIKNPNDNL